MRQVLVMLGMVLLLLLAACGGGETAVSPADSTDGADMAQESMDELMEDDAMDESMTDDGMDDSMEDSMEEHDAMAGEGEMMNDAETMAEDDSMMDDAAMEEEMMTSADLPAWQTMTLVDAVSGDSFSFAEFAGQTVFVEPMATWCSNCRRQLGNVQAAKSQLGEDVIFVALSVETTLDPDLLAEYAFNNGFDFRFAVLDQAGLQSLVDSFGTTAANPPATPHFIIRPDGTLTDLVTGSESPEQLIESIQAAQG